MVCVLEGQSVGNYLFFEGSCFTYMRNSGESGEQVFKAAGEAAVLPG